MKLRTGLRRRKTKGPYSHEHGSLFRRESHLKIATLGYQKLKYCLIKAAARIASQALRVAS